ncbi:uncharacterized protein [Hyperolius riggenbachi]|uniref:uncharacterized protein isoform X1 n=1 Tax=Hyperolius riggenbachi TaxID=752182 RepID=UPI0035A3239E
MRMSGSVLGLLGIVWWASAGGNTPGQRMTRDDHTFWRWGWANSTQQRTQDDFTCEAFQKCMFANWSMNSDAWTVPRPTRLVPNRKDLFAVYQDEVRIIATSSVNITCCEVDQWMELNVYARKEKALSCKGHRGYHLNITLIKPKILLCTNSTPIEGRGIWGDFITFINMDTARIDPGHIKRLPSTCAPVGLESQKDVINFNFTFPPTKVCRYKRAWYDTLLGGYGTLTGTLNGFDIETLANRMHNAGGKINDALTVQARWMPTIWHPLKLETDILDKTLDLETANKEFMYSTDTNISRIINWTMCSLQTIDQQQQKHYFQVTLMTGNEDVYRSVINTQGSHDTNGLWFQTFPEKVVCVDTWCAGTFYVYNVTKQLVMCKFVVLPLMIGTGADLHYWLPTFNGHVIDDDNRTHDLTFCDDTLNGKICKLQSTVYEPCLLQNTVNHCGWTIMPRSYRWMVEIAPQTVCVVTDREVVPKMEVPFVGCIHNISVLVWENETFKLNPDVEKSSTTNWHSTALNVPNWDLNLTKLKTLIEESSDIKKLIKVLNKTIAAHQISTTIIADKIIKVGSEIAAATSHHWWDIFMGYSPSAETALNWLFHPLLVVMIVVVVLSVWNCYVAYGICCKRKRILMVSYSDGYH